MEAIETCSYGDIQSNLKERKKTNSAETIPEMKIGVIVESCIDQDSLGINKANGQGVDYEASTGRKDGAEKEQKTLPRTASWGDKENKTPRDLVDNYGTKEFKDDEDFMSTLKEFNEAQTFSTNDATDT
ncbi:hypothetical protein PIB30_092467, partial [Stylosanthes scabra]|nr:hypothetical protein [Stylosanthes scabra]